MGGKGSERGTQERYDLKQGKSTAFLKNANDVSNFSIFSILLILWLVQQRQYVHTIAHKPKQIR